MLAFSEASLVKILLLIANCFDDRDIDVVSLGEDNVNLVKLSSRRWEDDSVTAHLIFDKLCAIGASRSDDARGAIRRWDVQVLDSAHLKRVWTGPVLHGLRALRRMERAHIDSVTVFGGFAALTCGACRILTEEVAIVDAELAIDAVVFVAEK